MARKHLLSDLVAGLPAGNSAVPHGERHPKPHAPAAARGAVGAVTRSLEQLKSQSVVDLRPDQIEASPIADRLPASPESHAELVASIREHGQQVPILVRPLPGEEGRYQIAYGRRRLRALAELGLPVRAVVKALSDDQLVVAQGMENTARADLSFIERALFAARLEAKGYRRDTIMAALSVDKTGLSRLIASASRVPSNLIVAIGPAPKAGRDRWMQLATRLDAAGARERAEALAHVDGFADQPTDERFTAVLREVSPERSAGTKPVFVKAVDGRRIARVKTDRDTTQLTFDNRQDGGFAAFLVDGLPEIFARYKRKTNPG